MPDLSIATLQPCRQRLAISIWSKNYNKIAILRIQIGAHQHMHLRAGSEYENMNCSPSISGKHIDTFWAQINQRFSGAADCFLRLLFLILLSITVACCLLAHSIQFPAGPAQLQRYR
ncbi:hypothetical protein [Undibacterium terreum]|uniref:hypothetical protein n=1 Tax=Undibacterium terreum TaxID=1224302 RepID=UPI001668195F|nr:hypothetical protein [Undibacterium terreum]